MPQWEAPLPKEAETEEGLVVAVPRQTTIGIGCGAEQRDFVQVTFLDDSRLVIRPAETNWERLGYVPVEGFALEADVGAAALRMVHPLRAALPVPLARADHELTLAFHIDGRKLERPTRVHLRQRDARQRVVGGIDIEFRPMR